MLRREYQTITAGVSQVPAVLVHFQKRNNIMATQQKTLRCTICKHSRRSQLEIGLVHHVPMRVLAARFGVSQHALHRHRHNHLSPQMAAAILAAQKPSAVDLEALQVSESEGLLSQLVAQRARLQTYADQCLELGDVGGATRAERSITANLELVGKLLGQLIQRHEVRSTSILVSPDYLRLRSVLVNALRPFPEAAQTVGRALHELEARAAVDIQTNAGKPPPMIEARPVEATA
jgi:hypothetical protein